jgi:hypothetical protein
MTKPEAGAAARRRELVLGDVKVVAMSIPFQIRALGPVVVF